MKRFLSRAARRWWGLLGTRRMIADAVKKSELGKTVVNPATELGGCHILNGYNYVKDRAAAVGMWHTVGNLLLHAECRTRSGRIPSVHIGFDGDSRLAGRREACQQVPSGKARIPSPCRPPGSNVTTRSASTSTTPCRVAEGDSSGPAYVDIPFDMCFDRIDGRAIVPRGAKKPGGPSGQRGRRRCGGNGPQACCAAKNPVIIAGGGVARAKGGEALKKLAELAASQ